MDGNTMIVRYVAALFFATTVGCAASTAMVRDTSPELARLIQNKAATVLVKTDNGNHGTGVILNHDGYILTVAHIFKDAKTITVIAHPDGTSTRTSSAKLITSRKSDDLAIIKTALPMPAVVSFGSLKRFYEGDTVYTESYPYRYGPLVTKGYLMSKHLRIEVEGIGLDDALIVDLPEGPGSSGCGLFAARDGTYMGILFLGLRISNADRKDRQLIMEMFHSVTTIRAFLDEMDIRYHIEYPEPKKTPSLHPRMDRL